jgi:protease I
MAVLSSSSWAVAVRHLEEEDSIVANELSGLRVVFLTANEGVEQVELTTPWQAVKDAGGTPELLAPKAAEVQAFNHLDKGDTFPAQHAIGEISPDDYHAVVLPGGVANPDQLRMEPAAVNFLRSAVQAGKPVAVICHGPWTLIEADVVRGRTLTSWPSLQTDIRNAGGTWVDTEVQVCTSGPNVLVSSRKPDDLPAFCAQFVSVFQQEARPA